MDDESFLEFVKTNAQRFETETLEAIVSHVNGIIGLRRTGKPPGLVIGSAIEAIHLSHGLYEYGEVTRLLGSSCMIQSPGFTHEQRIAYSKHAIRILDPAEWGRIEDRLRERRSEVSATIDAEIAERKADVEEAIRERPHAMQQPTKVVLRDGASTALYRGAYVHAYRADTSTHSYGVVVHLSPKGCYIAPPLSDYDERLTYGKLQQLEALTERQWDTVLAAFRKRDGEHDGSEVKL